MLFTSTHGALSTARWQPWARAGMHLVIVAGGGLGGGREGSTHHEVDEDAAAVAAASVQQQQAGATRTRSAGSRHGLPTWTSIAFDIASTSK